MKFKITNWLIIICIIFTIISFINNDLLLYWLNTNFLKPKLYLQNFIIQLFTYSFLHWWIMHLLFNSVFLYTFWNKVECLLWWKKYLIFFIFNTLFNAVAILIFSSWTTIWISWFCMSLLAYYTLHLKNNNFEYKWWITAIIINIIMWFWTNISLIWHLFWAIFWVIFYFLFWKKMKK